LNEDQDAQTEAVQSHNPPVSPLNKVNIKSIDQFTTMKEKFTSKHAELPSTLFSDLEIQITQERIRQARYSFNLALAMTAIFSVLGLTGIGLLIAGKIPEGVLATTGGMSPILPCLKFARDSNDRLDKILTELKNQDDND
jgi:hypothetical protein